MGSPIEAFNGINCANFMPVRPRQRLELVLTLGATDESLG